MSIKKKIKISDPVLGAKLNFKTYLQNRIFNFLSHLSEGPKSYDSTKTLGTLYTFIPLRLAVSVTSHFPLTPGGQNLCQKVSKIETAVQSNLPKLFFSAFQLIRVHCSSARCSLAQ